MKAQGETAIRIEIQNLAGSVEHYYHFLLGYLVPLVYWYSNNNGGNYAKVYVRSCALLDRILAEIDYTNIEILDKQKHLELAGLDSYEGRFLLHLKLKGIDRPDAYSRKVIMSARREIFSRLDISNMDIICEKVVSTNTEDGKTILIDRGAPNGFYQSACCEIPGGGNIRRSIPNMSEVESALEKYRPKRVYMEDLSLKNQAFIFHAADIVIAQHGAALSNLIFCRPTTIVCEIIPCDLIRGGVFSNYFRRLACVTRVKHRIVLQHGSHGRVNINSVLNALALERSSYKAEGLYYLFQAVRAFSQFRSRLKQLIRNFTSKPF